MEAGCPGGTKSAPESGEIRCALTEVAGDAQPFWELSVTVASHRNSLGIGSSDFKFWVRTRITVDRMDYLSKSSSDPWIPPYGVGGMRADAKNLII